MLVAFYAVSLSFISPGIVISRLHSDQLIYFTQAQYLAHHGTLEGLSFGDGLGPIVYSPVAGYVHAPAFLLSSDIDSAIRAIQVGNVAILALLGLLWWAYLRSRLPADVSRLWCLAPFAWLCLRYTPWFSNAYLPLGDHIFAVVQISFILICLNLDWWLASRARSACAVVLMAFALTMAAIQKFTGLALMAFLLVVLLQRYRWTRRQMVAGSLVVAVIVAGICLGLRGLYQFYLEAGLRNNVLAKPLHVFIGDSLLTLFGAALPAQLIPNYSYLFERSGDPVLALYLSAFRASWIPWLVVGFTVSATILWGAWRLRARLAPELALLALTVPVYAAITKGAGTVRYLAYTEPMFLVFFLAGALPAWRFVRVRFGTRGPLRSAVAVAVVLGISAVVGLGNSATARSATVMALPQFLRQLDHDIARVRTEVSEIAGRDTRFLNLGGQAFVWYPVAGVSYVRPDMAARMICEGRQVYVVKFCDRRNCGMVNRLSASAIESLDPRLVLAEPIYESRTTASEALIRPVRPAAGVEACAGP